jgi:hypothetical protein
MRLAIGLAFSSVTAPSEPGTVGTPAAFIASMARHLVAHQADGVGAGADEGKSGAFDRFSEIGVLREKTVTGVNSLGVGDFGGADDRRNVQVAVASRRRADAQRFVGEAYMHQVTVGLRVNGDGADTEFLAGAQDPQGNFAAVGDHDFRACCPSGMRCGGNQTMVNSGWSNSTGLTVLDQDGLDDAALVGLIWFIIFMASTMQITSPVFTVAPISTNDGEPGDGER